MRHARSDYNRIQDPEGLIPEDEPVFLLRAQDVNAPSLVHLWADFSRGLGVDNDMVHAAHAWAEEMEKWQDKHGMKIPDAPEGVFNK